MPNEQFSVISWTEQVTLQEDIDDGGHVDPLGHIILIPSQSFFALSSECCMLNRKAAKTVFEAQDLQHSR